jgi:hypothetical protein
LISHVIAVGMVAIYSFPAHKYFSFNIGIYARLHRFRFLVSG